MKLKIQLDTEVCNAHGLPVPNGDHLTFMTAVMAAVNVLGKKKLPEDYDGPEDAEALVKWMKEKVPKPWTIGNALFEAVGHVTFEEDGKVKKKLDLDERVHRSKLEKKLLKAKDKNKGVLLCTGLEADMFMELVEERFDEHAGDAFTVLWRVTDAIEDARAVVKEAEKAEEEAEEAKALAEAESEGEEPKALPEAEETKSEAAQ